MRATQWFCVFVMCVCVMAAQAGEGKANKEGKKKGEAASVPADATAPSAGSAPNAGKDKAIDRPDKAPKKDKTEKAAAKAERDAEEAKEAGGDESELGTLVQLLGLSESQQKEIGKEFERYRARLAQIKGLPDKSPNEKLLKGPQRRALREDLIKWVTAHVSSGQAQKLDTYEKKRAKDLFDEHVNNRVEKLTEKLRLTANQQSKVREVYDVQLRSVQNAADELYAATQKAGASTVDLEKSLEAKRDAMKKAVEGLLKPDQVEQYKKMED